MSAVTLTIVLLAATTAAALLAALRWYVRADEAQRELWRIRFERKER